MAEASKEMELYFARLDDGVTKAYSLATKARVQGYDPEEKVDIPVARDMAERVEGLMSAAAPQLIGSGMIQRIIELEKQYGRLSWEVALLIAEEVSKEKFCKFKDKKEAMEVGIRAGFTYHTLGIVSAPLEGFVELKIKKRADGKEYFAMSYAGPIRGAGGTAAAVSLIIADYMRKAHNYEKYDPTDKELSRAYTELEDYHERITRLQYHPSEEEVRNLVANLPVEIDGDPTEKLDVSNYKDIPRIETNKLRGGFCLVLSMVALKAPKLWAELSKWGGKYNLEWNFLEEFLKVQKKNKAKATESTTAVKAKITPDYTYIADLVAGRPVLAAPLEKGGFRLRYGRGRLSGYSAASIHPSTSYILDKFIATGTQLKTERPGKSASMTFCDVIDGPIVKLHDGSVIKVKNENEAKRVTANVSEILFLGDILVSYGDFSDRNHMLVPAGYCDEWWSLELEKSIVDTFGSLDLEKTADLVGISDSTLKKFLKGTIPAVNEAVQLSQKLKVPLHPEYTFYWNCINKEQILSLLEWLDSSKLIKSGDTVEKIILPIKPAKRILELIGMPHLVATESIVIEKNEATALYEQLGIKEDKEIIETTQAIESQQKETAVELISAVSRVPIRDKCGTFIGARMGRPEKAKMRKLTGSPHVLFPVAEQGGRLRSFQSALEAGKIEADFAIYRCLSCGKETVFSICENCEKKTIPLYDCKICGSVEEDCGHHPKRYKHISIPIKDYFNSFLKKTKMEQYPDLIKGVKGTSNKDHRPEHLAKGILRAKHGVNVNKDGTTRYDMTELPITHFRPKEIGVSVEKLRDLGYIHDMQGNPLESDEQTLEIKPQDVIIPCCPDSSDEPADEILFRVANFVDDLLVNFYNLEPFYNLESKKDLVGHLVIGLAPHISAGILGRIIGFSKTQGCFAHPLWHAAHRRDCDGDENCIMLLMDALLNFSRQYLPDTRGAKTMDAPLVLTTVLKPAEVDDMVHKLDIGWRYPLELYEAGLNYKSPKEVKIEQLKSRLGTEGQYESMGFTHDCSDMNVGARCSAYKTIPTMEDKLKGQMALAEKIRAVNENDVARLVIEKHFIKDIKGNLRKFSMQKFRCIKCNESYRRPPLVGKCTKCGGKLVFTISEGSILKYLEPSLSLAKKYKVPAYLKQTLDLTKERIEGIFGKEQDKQAGLGAWFG